MRPPSRRAFLATSGAAALSGLAGCSTAQNLLTEVDPYPYHSDAVLGDSPGPWPTLGYDARRTGHRPAKTTLPSDPRVERVALAGQFADFPPAVADGVVYSGVEQGAVVDADGGVSSEGESFAGFLASDVEDEFESGAAVDAGETIRWRDARERGLAAPTVVGGTAFLTSAGRTAAVDRKTGETRWAYAAGFGGTDASPTVSGGTVYVTDERAVALDARTGEKRWTAAETPSWIAGTAADDDAMYATAGNDGEAGVYALDPADGSLRWSAETAGDCYVPPAVGEDVVAVVTAGSRLHAFSRGDGEERWSRRLGDGTQTAPAVADRTVYVMDERKDALLAYDAASGEKRWGTSLGPTVDRRPAVSADAVYVLGNSNEMHSRTLCVVDRETGDLRREVPLELDPTSAPVLADDAVYLLGERWRGDEPQYGVYRVGGGSV